MRQYKKYRKIITIAAGLLAMLVLFQNCNGGPGEATQSSSSTAPPGSGGGGTPLPPPTCPRNSNAAPVVTGFSTNNLTFNIGMGRDAGTDGPKQLTVNFNSGDDYSAVVDVNCNVPRNSGLTVNCGSPNSPVRSGSINISVNAANGAECLSGNVQVAVRVEDVIVNANNQPITACNNLSRESNPNSFTVTIQNACLPTQRVNPDVPYDAGQMGNAVAISGNWAVAVAPRDETKASDAGAAFVMARNGNSWSIVQKLIPSTLAAGDHLSSVALSGNTLVLGAPIADFGNGAAWIYQYNGNQWQEVKTITPPEGGGGLFGTALAISNGTVAISAPFANLGGGLYSGAVYLYSGTNWNAINVVEPSNGVLPYGEFGTSVALSGSTLVVGAPFPNSSTTRQEAVYVFNGTTLQRKILNPRNVANARDRFGYAVSLSGNNLLVGAPYNTNRRGIAYLYQTTNGQFPASPARNYVLADPNNNDVDSFGHTVAVNGNRIVIGAPDKAEGAPKFGAVYLFSTANNNQLFKIRSRAEDRGADSFGHSVALGADGWLIVGALNDEHNLNVNNSGSVYFVDLP